MMLKSDIDTFTADQEAGHHTFTAYIHTTSKDISVFKIYSVDVISDFLSSYADRVVLKGLVTQSAWVHDVLQARANLEMTIIKKTSATTYVTRYKAVVPDVTVKQSNVDFSTALEREELDRGGLAMFELHGKHRFTEVAPLPTVSGTFSNLTVDVIMSKCIKYYMRQTPLPFGPSLDECIIVPPNNQQVLRQVTVPTATPLLRLPQFIQTKYGIYTSGIGSYLRPFEDGSKVWWVYPLYGNFEWKPNIPKLTILIPVNRNDKRALLMRNTIQRTGNTTVIVGHLMDTTVTDLDPRPIVRPTGFKIADTERTLEHSVTYKSGEVTVSAGDRFRNISQYTRDDGLPLDVPTTYVSNNYYTASSDVSANKTIPVVIRWENGINELLVPGMVVQVMYDQASKGLLRYGRLVGCHSISKSVTGDNHNVPIFSETCMLTINVEHNQ